jgi:hypothetical protein
VNAACEAWFEGQLDLDPARIVFIDETAANTKMARLRSCAQRRRATVPHGHWKTTTFTAGLCYDGIAARMVLDGPMNGEAFFSPMLNRRPLAGGPSSSARAKIGDDQILALHR